MLSEETMTIKPLELLDFFRSCRFLGSYGLALYQRKYKQVTRFGPESHVCGDFMNSLHCGELCSSVFENAVKLSLSRDKPVVFRCRTGLLNFAVPLFPDGLISYCLVGGGLREQSVDLSLLETLAKSGNIDPFALLEKLEELPVASLPDVKETAVKVHNVIASYQRENLHSRLLDKTMDRLNIVAAISVQVDKSGNADEAVQLLNEALGILFDLPKIAIVLRNGGGDGFSVRANLGLPGECADLPGNGVRELFPDNCGENAVLTGKEIKYFFPGVDSADALCVPIRCNNELLGFLALFDAELHQRDMRMVELLMGRLSSKIMLARKEEEHARENLDILNSVLTQAGVALERTRSEEKADRLEQLCMTDPLTGLFNQRFLESRLEEELSRSSRHGENLAVMLVDLDNFRIYNDLWGGNAGDAALKQTALLLKASSRQMDTATSVAWGRFCIIVPGASRSESLIVAERIRSKIERTAFLHEENPPSGRLTASIGISLFPENGDTAEKLLKAADTALNRANTAGHNRVVYFTPETKGGGRVVSMHAVSRQR